MIPKKNSSAFISTPQKIKKILVLRNGLLGDTVFITAMLHRLNSTFSNAVIDVIVGKNSTEVLKEFPGIRKIIPFNFNFSATSILKQTRFFLPMSAERYDLVIVPEVNPHYTLMAKLSFPRKLAAFTSSISKICDYHIERPKQKAVLADTRIVTDWTISDEPDKARLYLSEEEISEARRVLSTHGILPGDKILFFNPGSSKQYSEKDWGIDNYAPVADHFIAAGNYKIVFNGLPRDKEDYAEMASKMKYKPVLLCGENTVPVRIMFAIISLSELVFGVDTGPIHIATAFDVPVLCLMGYMDQNDTGPYHPDVQAKVLTSSMPCSPCVHTNPKPAQWDNICRNQCPVECMKKITPEVVIKEIEEMLK